ILGLASSEKLLSVPPRSRSFTRKRLGLNWLELVLKTKPITGGCLLRGSPIEQCRGRRDIYGHRQLSARLSRNILATLSFVWRYALYNDPHCQAQRKC